MEKKELKERMRHGLLDLAPDIYDQIQHAPLPDFLILESESSGQIPASLSQQRYRRFYRFAAVAAACLLLFLLPGILRESSVYVLLEINPSICLELNTDYQLRTAKGLNSDGVQLLEELSFDKYEPLEQVMEHLFTQLQADDYLHNDGGILVSVSRTEEPFYQELKDRLQDEISRNLLRTGISSFSVAFQFTEHAESTGRKALERELAEKHGLSPAEAASLNIRELINCAQEYGVPELEISETEATETEGSEPEITETGAAETETTGTGATGTEAAEMGAAVSPAKEAPDTPPSSGKTSPSSRQTEETAEVLPETAEETEPESEAETPAVSAPEPSVSAAQTQTSGSDKNSRQEETSETHSSPPSPPKKKPGKTSKKTKKEKKNSSAKRKKKSSSSSKKNKSSSSKRKKKSSSSNKKKENSSARKKKKSSSSNKKKENSSAKKKKSNHSSQKKKESSTPRKKSAKAASGKAEDSKSARKQEETSKPATSKDASSLNSNAPSSKKKQANGAVK